MSGINNIHTLQATNLQPKRARAPEEPFSNVNKQSKYTADSTPSQSQKTQSPIEGVVERTVSQTREVQSNIPKSYEYSVIPNVTQTTPDFIQHQPAQNRKNIVDFELQQEIIKTLKNQEPKLISDLFNQIKFPPTTITTAMRAMHKMGILGRNKRETGDSKGRYPYEYFIAETRNETISEIRNQNPSKTSVQFSKAIDPNLSLKEKIIQLLTEQGGKTNAEMFPFFPNAIQTIGKTTAFLFETGILKRTDKRPHTYFIAKTSNEGLSKMNSPAISSTQTAPILAEVVFLDDPMTSNQTTTTTTSRTSSKSTLERSNEFVTKALWSKDSKQWVK